ncbi:DnaJ domain-containing protein [Parvularcula bermudensis]|nr:DnaJ domain-containing protein [Parvularcula bermudensis]
MGFDIRVKPTRGGSKRRRPVEETATRQCEHEDCAEVASVRVAKSPDQPNIHIWLCQAHAREHNKNWNFFEGKTDAEAAAIRNQARYGDRPTWKMSKNGRAAAAAKAAMGGAQGAAEDQLGLASDRPQPQDDGIYREGRRLTRLQVQAFRTLNLKPTSSSGDIRKRYAELVKRFHPDSNEGDRSAEHQLQEVIKAHQILKKANFI